MRKFRTIAALFLAICLLFMSSAAIAAPTQAESSANKLYSLKLFLGTGTKSDGTPEFDLGSSLTRSQAVTMLVRLLGEEDAAKADTWQTPFKDLEDWAKPYVGFAYNNGLTLGVSATEFSGGTKVTVAQYLTLVLRALGFDSEADFQWDKSWEFSDELGLTDGEYGAGTTTFNRGDAAIISFNSLSVATKGSEEPLYKDLIAAGVFSEAQAGSVGLGKAEDPDDEIDASEFEKKVFELTNAERAKAGVPALSWNDKLAGIARAHSQDMATRDYFDHYNPEGLSPFDRMKNAGISYRAAAENIAWGQKTPEEVVDAWMNSEGHKANILNAKLTQLGVGFYSDYWTQAFIGN